MYLFAGPGAVTASGVSAAVIHGGVEFEIRLPARLTAGAEAGVLSGLQLTGAAPIASVNGYYHFVHDRSRKLGIPRSLHSRRLQFHFQPWAVGNNPVA